MEILGTSTVSASVESLIERSQSVLFIVSAYFKPWDRVSRAIKGARARNVQVVMLLRGGDKRVENLSRSAEFVAHGVRVALLSRLHAKIYASESEVILTSMNLYDSSALDSFEVAVRFTKEADPEAFRNVLEQVRDLGRKAEEEAKVASVERNQVHPIDAALLQAKPARPASRPAARERGHCIRCDAAIPFDPERPFCADCYKSWAKYANPDYEEAQCHRCGKAGKTSAAKPLCRPCWSATA